MTQDQVLGEIRVFAFGFAPQTWERCDGQLLPISKYQALFALIGTTYGGDGKTSFALPDLRGRTMVHYGQGKGFTNMSLGDSGGVSGIALTEAQLPPHAHTATLNAVPFPALSETAEGNFLADGPFYAEANLAPTREMRWDAVTTAKNGAGTLYDNRPPSLCLNYCIAVTGMAPDRD